MATNATTHAREASLAWSAVRRASRLSLFWFIGWFWFLSSDDSAWRTASLVAVLGLAGLVAITWYASRARADRRWWAAVDRYARQEQAKGAHARKTHRR